MIITNKFFIPEPIVHKIRQLQREPVDGVFHVTEILDSPQIAALNRKHFHEIIVDASDLIKSFIGISMHATLHKAAEELYAAAEITMEMKVLGWILTGTTDFIGENPIKKISDYKFTSAWTMVYNPNGREDWFWQVNIYAEMARRVLGWDIQEAEIIPMFYDWKEWDALRNPDYPQNMVIPQKVELISSKEIMKYIRSRVKLHKAAVERKVYGKCTSDDQWQRQSKFAVIKKGGKRAIKNGVFDDEASALSLLGEKGNSYEIEHRPARKVRCSTTAWCPGRDFCSQRLQEELENGENASSG